MQAHALLRLLLPLTLLLTFLTTNTGIAQRRFPYEMTLDSRSVDTLRTPDATSSRHRYRITAWGTYSMWEDTVNSSVDPMWIYSFPAEEWAKPEWRIFTEGYPIYVGDQRMLDAHGLRIDTRAMPKQPLNNQHRYSMIVQGTGRPIGASIVDWNYKNFVKTDAHGNNSGYLHVLIEELPLTEWEICAIDSSNFPEIRLSVKVLRDSVRQEDVAGGLLLSENGVPVAINRVDCSERTNSVSVAMVFDRSGSMAEPFGTSDRITYTRSAGKKFIDKLEGNDEAAIYSFSSSTTLDQTWTADKTKLRRSIDNLQPDGWTAMNDAAYRAIVDIEARPSSRSKAVVVLSDGEDNRSTIRDITTVINRAKQAGVPVFGIGLQLDTDDSLRILAQQTGGRYFSVRDASAIDSVFNSIAEIVFEKGCCSIFYTSPDSRRDGSWRQVSPFFTYDGDTLPGQPTGYHAPRSVSSVDGGERGVSAILGLSPNPMSESGMLRFNTRGGGSVRIDLLDVQGEVVLVVFEGVLPSGEQSQQIRTEGLAPGRYFIRLSLPEETAIYPVQVQ